MDERLIWQQAQDVIKDAISSNYQSFAQFVARLFTLCNGELIAVSK